VFEPLTTDHRFLAATVFATLAVQSPTGISTRRTRRPAESPPNQPAGANLSRDYGKLPLAFEPNVGRTVESLRVEPGGDMVPRTALGGVRQQKPRVYREVGGQVGGGGGAVRHLTGAPSYVMAWSKLISHHDVVGINVNPNGISGAVSPKAADEDIRYRLVTLA
jgi:hypothetical protein